MGVTLIVCRTNPPAEAIRFPLMSQGSPLTQAFAFGAAFTQLARGVKVTLHWFRTIAPPEGAMPIRGTSPESSSRSRREATLSPRRVSQVGIGAVANPPFAMPATRDGRRHIRIPTDLGNPAQTWGWVGATVKNIGERIARLNFRFARRLKRASPHNAENPTNIGIL